MRILKFGGKSVATIEKMQKIAKFIKKIYKNDKKIIIVISAMGSRTDELTRLANEFGSENLSKKENSGGAALKGAICGGFDAGTVKSPSEARKARSIEIIPTRMPQSWVMRRSAHDNSVRYGIEISR